MEEKNVKKKTTDKHPYYPYNHQRNKIVFIHPPEQRTDCLLFGQELWAALRACCLGVRVLDRWFMHIFHIVT